MLYIVKKVQTRDWFFFVFCFLLGLFRFSAFGFSYYPLLDDFLQYGVYPRLADVWNTVLAGGAGTVYVRPFAALGDVYIWGRFWGSLGTALVILCALYAASALLFCSAARKAGLPLSPWFLLFYLFLPLNLEGTYWISASSRVVTALFFSACGLWTLLMFLRSRGKRWFALYLISSLLACGYYEQILAVYVTANILVLIKEKRYFLMAVPVSFLLLTGILYVTLGKTSANSGRMETVVLAEVLPHARIVLTEWKELLLIQAPRVLINGFPRGLSAAAGESLWLWMACAAIVSVCWGTFTARWEEEEPFTPRKILLRAGIGLLLIAAAFSPFFLAKEVWLNFRNLVPALPGFGILFDLLFRLTLHNGAAFRLSGRTERLTGRKAIRILRGVLGGLILFVFLTVTVSELADYRTTGRMDCAAAHSIARRMHAAGKNRMEVMADIPVYPEQNTPYHDHIMSVFGSSWGISGAVRAVSGDFDLSPVLVPSGN